MEDRRVQARGDHSAGSGGPTPRGTASFFKILPKPRHLCWVGRRGASEIAETPTVWTSTSHLLPRLGNSCGEGVRQAAGAGAVLPVGTGTKPAGAKRGRPGSTAVLALGERPGHPRGSGYKRKSGYHPPPTPDHLE